MGSPNLLSLNLADVLPELLELCRSMDPAPQAEVLADFLNLAFFASLEREEGQPTRFSLALLDGAALAQDGNFRDWRPIPFQDAPTATVTAIAKLAPAVDERHNHIAIACSEGKLRVAGIIRTNSAHYRFSLGQLGSASFAGHQGLVVRAVDSGVIEVEFDTRPQFRMTRGEILRNGVNVFMGGAVSSVLGEHARRAGLDSEPLHTLLRLAVQELSLRGKGGTVLILPRGYQPDPEHLDFRFAVSPYSEALQDIVRYSAGESLGSTAHTSGDRQGQSLSEHQEELSRARQRAVTEFLFMDDGARFAADLASVDGALVISSDFRIVGFGAHILVGEPHVVPVFRANDPDGTEGEMGTLDGLGTRHHSAARLCLRVPGALAFVVSQDGAVSCLYRAGQSSRLVLWRPMLVRSPWR